jgi:hypothetical protein
MPIRLSSALTTAVVAAGLVVMNPAPAPAAAASPAVASAAGSNYGGRISRVQVLRRAQDWLRRDLSYSQDNSRARWDLHRGRKYRPDCSGFVSMAWALEPRRIGRALVTWELPTVAEPISWAGLRGGDALLRLAPGNRGTEHVQLFHRWTGSARTRAVIIEQSGSHDGMRRKIVTVSGARAGGYRPYRYRNIV